MNLYNLTNEFMEQIAELESFSEEMGGLDPEVFRNTLDSMQAPIEEKVENIVKYMKSLEALADAKKLEAKRLSDSASADLKKAEFFKNYMADNLNKAGIKKLQAGIFSLGWRKGSEVVQITDFEQLPHTVSINLEETKVVTFEPKINKTFIKKFIKEHGDMPGAVLVRNPDSLTIK